MNVSASCVCCKEWVEWLYVDEMCLDYWARLGECIMIGNIYENLNLTSASSVEQISRE